MNTCFSFYNSSLALFDSLPNVPPIQKMSLEIAISPRGCYGRVCVAATTHTYTYSRNVLPKPHTRTPMLTLAHMFKHVRVIHALATDSCRPQRIPVTAGNHRLPWKVFMAVDIGREYSISSFLESLYFELLVSDVPPYQMPCHIL